MNITKSHLHVEFPRNVHFECSLCALCCGDTETNVRKILLLKKEAEKISKKTRKDIESFAEKINDKAPYAYVMRKTNSGKCVFLKGKLCIVYDTRPLICRFYPFKIDNLGNQHYTFSYTKECPGIGRGPQLKRKFFETLFAELISLMKKIVQ
ncbi:YkgJ family cysteine cluster protein [Candidatus Bathyarchaeota archaeon]|nr:YkgJ family cysteine cluster protein [Candidatus Bathyarchaeota archaeon]